LAGDLSKPLTSKRNQSQASIAAGAGYPTLNCRINHSVVFVSSSWSPSGAISKFIFMNRKNFLKTASLFALSAPYSSTVLTNWLRAMNKLESIGLGLFSVPKLLENNLEAGVKALAQLGITEFETYGPYSFSDVRNKKFWNEVTPGLGFSVSGFYGKTAAQFNEILGNYGISVPALHTDLYTLEESMGALAEAANTLGAKYVVLPSIPDKERTSLDAYKQMAERFNKIGKNAQAEGIHFAYHNHGYGLIPDDSGMAPIDLIFEGTDPEMVFFEMDLFWMVAGKANPEAMLKKHSGRFKMLHIKDMKKLSHFSGDGSTPDQWMELFPNLVAAGEGVIPIKDIIKVAAENGVDHYFIEHDFAPDPIKNIGAAAEFLKGLRW
jgi:sugar phosphate isomerase/epimerase